MWELLKETKEICFPKSGDWKLLEKYLNIARNYTQKNLSIVPCYGEITVTDSDWLIDGQWLIDQNKKIRVVKS